MVAETDLLQALKLVEEISTSLNTTAWIWGGLVADIYQGCLLREHHDLDYLTLGLHELLEPVSHAFHTHGWHTKPLSNGDLQVRKDDVEIQLGHVSLTTEARWTHNGDLGSLFFPQAWLPQRAEKFYGLEVHAVAPEFQYVLMAHPEWLNPKWIEREKDIAAQACLGALLSNNGIILSELESQVHS